MASTLNVGNIAGVDVLKLDTLQNPNGSSPTASDLGLDISGNVLQVNTASDNIGGSTVINNAATAVKSITFSRKASDSKFIIVVRFSCYRPDTSGWMMIGYQRNSETPVYKYGRDDTTWDTVVGTFEDSFTGSVGDSVTFYCVAQNTYTNDNQVRDPEITVYEIA